MTDIDERLDRLESLVEQQQDQIDDQQATIEAQQETIEAQRERIAAVTGENGEASDSGSIALTRRNAVTAGGLLALLFGGVGTVSADPRGQVGTEDRPLETLYAEELDGGLTGNTAVTSLAGTGLTTDGNELGIADDGVTGTQIDLSTLAGEGIEVSNGELWVPSSASAPSDLNAVLGDVAGDGTSGSPYQITDVEELQAMNAEPDAHYELASDIDASATTGWNDGNGFDPVGDSSNPFTGTFDGTGHTITGLTIDRSENDVGLFGFQEGTVESVALRNVSITGNDDVGALVGYNYGTVRDALAEGSVTGTDTAGGLVGESSGVAMIERAAAFVTVSGDTAGGLVGYQGEDVLRDSYATGDVDGSTYAGGVIGQTSGGTSNRPAVERTYATGTVTGGTVGGLIGDNSYASVLDSYWDTNATGQGSDFGDSYETGTVTGNAGLSTSEMQGAEAESNMSGLSFSTPATWATVDAGNDATVSSDDYPVLRALDRATQLEARE